MEGYYTLVSLAIFVPFLGMLINLFFGGNLKEKTIGFIAVSASGFAFLVAVVLYIALLSGDFEGGIVNMPIVNSWIYIPSGGVDIPWQFRVDTLSVTMMLVVTGIGTLIHIYAIGYMHGDSRFPRFFVYLNLFLFFMLILVTGNNFLMMFVGWEGVGLCSFLLIGFWFDKDGKHPTEDTVGWANSNAARKAFIANRVGDFGLLMAMFIIFWTFGTLDYYKPNEEIHVHFEEETAARFFEIEGIERLEEHGTGEHHGEPEAGTIGVFTQAEYWFEAGDHKVDFGAFSMSFEATVTIITLFLLLGVTGKSAQIPLFVWLPDAMAGPTPVSALIHAATMVTAGIYLSVRSNSLFYHSDVTNIIIVLVGAGTALIAGFMALGQWDVKKVLAYSTVSQLGFMVTAIGLGAYTAAMFHLVTHAFFKALLFLGSGSIIHGVEHGHHHAHKHGHGHDDHHEEAFDPQDMRNMGGLRHRMPVTYLTYMVGALALAGVIPFAGFWSKDEIIVDAFNVGFEDGEFKGLLALILLFIAAAFTAFYVWRQVALVFYGEPRSDAAKHAPESVGSMTTPLVILAAGSIAIGFMNIPSGFPILSWMFGEHVFANWLEASVIHAHGGSFNVILALIATVVAVGAIFMARAVYSDKVLNNLTKDPLEEDARFAEIFRLSNVRLYWDESYFMFIIYPFQRMANIVAHAIDWRFWHDFVHERVIFSGFQGMADVTSQPVDRSLIDQGFMSIARGVRGLGGQLRKIQTGYVRTYAFSVVFGVLLVIVIILLPVLRDMLGI